MQQNTYHEDDGIVDAVTLHHTERRRSTADSHTEEYPHDYDSAERDVPHRADGEVASPDEHHMNGADTNAATPSTAHASLYAPHHGLAETSATVHDTHSTRDHTASRAFTDDHDDEHGASNAAAFDSLTNAEEANNSAMPAPRAAHARSSQAVKRKQQQQPQGPRVSLLNVHKVNAIPEGVNTPRSRALCDKYSINPRDLARRTVQDFEKPGVPADLANMRYRSYQNRLHAHMAVLLPEYTQLLQEEAEQNRINAEKQRLEEAQRAAQAEQQRRASMHAMQERQQQRRRSSAYAGWDAASPLRAKGESPQRRGSAQDERVATVQERRRLLSEIQHMELVRKMLEKDKEVYQRLRDLADEREIFSELHHLQSGEPKYRQYKELKSLAHVAAQYSRGRYRSPKRALEPAVLEEAMEHLSAQRDRARSSSRGRE